MKPDGVITLILPLNLVAGATPQSCEFRKRWLADVRIERIINFADVRRLLFPAAKHPCAVVRVRPRPPVEGVIDLAEEQVDYWAPKADVSLALGRLALHPSDQKLLSVHDIYAKPHLLISAYWGEQRDLDLLRRLQRFGTLAQTMAGRPEPWVSGKGFHAPNLSNRSRSLGPLEALAFLPADRMPRDYPVIASDVQLDQVKDHFYIVASPGGKNARLYHGPRVILPDGLTEEYGIRAAYTHEAFAFTSSIGAIGGGPDDEALLKFLAAYLRSPVATYLLILTGYSVIQPQNYARLATPLLHRPASREVGTYVKVLARALETHRRHSGGHGGLNVDAVVDGNGGFFGAVRISLSGENNDRATLVRSEEAFHALLMDVEAAFESQLDRTERDALFKIPNAMVVAGDAFYFLKPMRRRFWLARAALADADLIARTVQAAAWKKLTS